MSLFLTQERINVVEILKKIKLKSKIKIRVSSKKEKKGTNRWLPLQF